MPGIVLPTEVTSVNKTGIKTFVDLKSSEEDYKMGHETSGCDESYKENKAS